MGTQLLFYEAAVPVSANRHGDWAIEPHDYSFSRNINSVPLTAVEFPAAAAEYAIVFAGQRGTLMPAAILGVRAAQNLFLDDKGGWDAKYVPAFVRRYPFVFSSPDQGKSFTLCIDETFAGFNREGRGQRLFDEDRKTSAYTDNVLKFLKQYQLEFQRTQAFCRKLEELDLLEPMQARISGESGERMSLAGFMAVDRNKLKALAPEQLAELARSDALEMIYVHLQSMRNFGLMRARMNGTAANQPQVRPEPAAAAATPAPAAQVVKPIETRPSDKPADARPKKKQERKLSS